MQITLNHSESTVSITLPDQVWNSARTGLNAADDSQMADWLVGRLFQAGELALTDSLRSQVVIDAD